MPLNMSSLLKLSLMLMTIAIAVEQSRSLPPGAENRLPHGHSEMIGQPDSQSNSSTSSSSASSSQGGAFGFGSMLPQLGNIAAGFANAVSKQVQQHVSSASSFLNGVKTSSYESRSSDSSGRSPFGSLEGFLRYQ